MEDGLQVGPRLANRQNMTWSEVVQMSNGIGVAKNEVGDVFSGDDVREAWCKSNGITLADDEEVVAVRLDDSIDAKPCVISKVRELWFVFLSGTEGGDAVRALLKQMESSSMFDWQTAARRPLSDNFPKQHHKINEMIQNFAVFPSSPIAPRPLNKLGKLEEMAEFRLERENSSQRNLVKKNSRTLSLRTPKGVHRHDSQEPEKTEFAIPQFFFPHGRDMKEREERENELIVEFFRQGCATQSDFGELTVEVIGLPSFYSAHLYDRIVNSSTFNPDGESALSADMFWEYYNSECVDRTKTERLFYSLQNGANRKYLVPSDFEPLLKGLLDCHPGLAFLESTPEFQFRYMETAIQRIYYTCAGTQCNSRLTLRQLEQGKVLDTLMRVDEEEDINAERRFFSYEHFYVLYCGFWELDTDHDLMISFEDLLRYRGYSLTYRIVERVFGGFGRPLDSSTEGYMSYHDYIWFALSEEDKRSATALDYWFRCVDLDGDGIISLYDIDLFYSEQTRRMECLGHEVVPLTDIICQGLDMTKGQDSYNVRITRADLKRSQLGAEFFNILFNINKFFSQESRDAVRIRRGQEFKDLSDWDRFAAAEYLRLTAEEEDDGGEDSSWDDLNEQRVVFLDAGGNF